MRTVRLVSARGTNGAGKSWLAHELLRLNNMVQEVPAPRPNKLAGVVLSNRVALVGSYHNKCGGADGIGNWNDRKGMDWVEDYLWTLADIKGVRTVFVEGMTIVGWTRWSRISQEWQEHYGHSMTWLFFDTPLDVCYSRVMQRNGGKPFNRSNLEQKYNGVLSVQRKAEAAGEDVVVLDHKNPWPQFIQTLGLSENPPNAV